MQNCIICQRQNNPDDETILYQDEHWIVRHSRETNILGYVLIESRRHFLDLAEADESECLSIGPLMHKTIAAVRRAVKPQRVYSITLAEAVPHFHIHIIPRTEAVPRAYRGRGILAYPLHPQADPHLMSNVCSLLRKHIRVKAHPSIS